MKRYIIEYRSENDPGCPVFAAVWRGYDKSHALDRFWSAPDGDGWEIISIKLAPAKVSP